MSFRLIFSLLSLSVVIGCVGGKIGGITPAKELPQEITKDVKKKFEITSDTVVVEIKKEGLLQNKNSTSNLKKKTSKKQSKKKIKTKSQTSFILPNRRPKDDPLWVGERMLFELTYFGLPAAEFSMEVLPFKEINNRKVYHVRGEAKTLSIFNWFYRINDSVESYFDYDGFFSYRFHLNLDETKQTRKILELNDSEKKKTFFWSRWNHHKKGYKETKKFFKMKPFSQDSLSAIYYVRTLDLPTGAVIRFPVISEGKNWEAEVTVVRREKVKTALGLIDTIVLRPVTKYKGVLKQQGNSYIWLSDDDRRFILRIEAKVKIGKFIAKLKSIDKGVTPVGAR